MVNTPYYYYQPVGRQDIRHEDEPTSYLPMSCHLDPPEREVVDVDILERKASGDQTVVVRGVVSDKVRHDVSFNVGCAILQET